MRRNVITVTFLLISSPSIFMITINNSDHTIFEYRSDPRSYAHYWTSSWIEFFELAWIRLIFFRPYFNYWCNSVHNCEDGFYICFFNCSAQIWFLYIYSHYKIFCHIRSLHLLLKAYCAVPIMSTLNWILSTIWYASYYLAVFCIFRLEISIRRLQFHRHVKNIM